MIACEDQVQQGVVVETGAEALDLSAGGGAGGQECACPVQEHDRHPGAGLAYLLLDHGAGERRRVGLDEMEEAGHQNTRYRWAFATSAAIPSGVMGTTGCPSAFQDASAGAASFSTWKETPSFLSAARNLAMSSPSTRSSVSSSRRWTAGPVSTTSRGVSPATMPSAMRMASIARCETRGSSELRTRTGCRAATLVEREEAIGRVDDIGQHDEAAVGRLVRQRQAALLAAVGADEELRASVGQRRHARVLHGADAVVDQVEVNLGAAVQRRAAESDGRVQVGMLGRRRKHETKLALRQLHDGAERSTQREERQ